MGCWLWWSLLLTVSAGYICPAGGTEETRTRRQATELICDSNTQTAIQSSWQWAIGKTCVDLIQTDPLSFETNPVTRGECQRWLDLPVLPDRVSAVFITNEFCKDLENGTARFRYEICCDDQPTEQRCFQCSQSPVVKDEQLYGFQTEECNYHTDMVSCAAGEVCHSQFRYYNKNGSTIREIYKGCMEASACEAEIEASKQDVCDNGRPYIACTECCADSFCNLNVWLPQYNPLDSCRNGGTLIIDENAPMDFECECPPEATGELCETLLLEDPCETLPCENDGECTSLTEPPYFECDCRPGFEGDYCEEVAPECPVVTPPLCEQDGSVCYQNDDGTKSCRCADGYVGSRCIYDTVECESDNLFLEFGEAFKGSWDSCDTAIKKITQKESTSKYSLRDCLEFMGGTFVDGNSFGAVSEVPLTGLLFCEESSTKPGVWIRKAMCCPSCFSSPCQNAARCLPVGQGYVCKCRFGFEGVNCEVEATSCLITGDPHFLTFDGQLIDYQGPCKYTLTTLSEVIEGIPHFEVNVKHEDRGYPNYGFIQYVEIIIEDIIVVLGKDNVITVNSEIVHPGVQNSLFKIIQNGRNVRFQTYFNLIVEFDGDWSSQIKVPDDFAGALEGLCGNFDNDTSNEFLLPNGTDVKDDPYKFATFGNAWQIYDENEPNCTSPAIPPTPCTGELIAVFADEDHCGYANDSSAFSQCVTAEPQILIDYLDNCIYDSCATTPDHNTTICRSLEALALSCTSKGYAVDNAQWRSDTGCYPDCGEDMEYNALTTACPISCSNPHAPQECPLPDNEACVCKADKPVLKNGQCVPADECYCEDENGQQYKAGEYWYTEDCETRVDCVNCTHCDIPIAEPEVTEPGCAEQEMCTNETGVLSCVERCPDPDRVWRGYHTDCQKTCDIRSSPLVCDPGCRCEPHLVENEEGECVDPDTCGCLEDDGTHHDVGDVWLGVDCDEYTCVACDDNTCLYPFVNMTHEGCRDFEKACRLVIDEYECTDECDADKTFIIGTTACPATCEDPSAPDTCTADPVSACRCADGLLLNDNNECVEPPDCGCKTPSGTWVAIGETWTTPDCKLQECVPCPADECPVGVGKAQTLDECSSSEVCESTCTVTCSERCIEPGTVYMPVNTNCPVSCSQRNVPTYCEAGCRCPSGQVRGNDGSCVDPDDCGCVEDDGTTYEVNSVWYAEGCDEFTCMSCNNDSCTFPYIDQTRVGCPNDDDVCRYLDGEYECTEDCDADKEYSTDMTACPATCDDPLAPESCSLNNTRGCKCPDGQLLKEDNSCVDPPDCGCEKPDGQRVQIGETWKTADCKTMVCVACSVDECDAAVGKAEVQDECPSDEECQSSCQFTCNPNP